MQTVKTSTIVCSFLNINPINTVEEGIAQGHYTGHYQFITNKTVPLQPVQGGKNLYLVCFNRTIVLTDVVQLLRTVAKRPCRNAPQYLLGLMAQVPEDKMPDWFRNKYIIAAEPDNKSSVFTDERDHHCFLCIFRGVDGGRELSLASNGGFCDGGYAYLAEDLVP